MVYWFIGRIASEIDPHTETDMSNELSRSFEPSHIVVVQTSGLVDETDDNYVEIKGSLLGTESGMFTSYDDARKWLVNILLEAHGGEELDVIVVDDIVDGFGSAIEHFTTSEGPTHGYVIEL